MACVQALQFRGLKDCCAQLVALLIVQSFFNVQPKPPEPAAVRDDRASKPRAMGDGTGNSIWPTRKAITGLRGRSKLLGQAMERPLSTNTSSKKFGLPLWGCCADVGGRENLGCRKIENTQLRRMKSHGFKCRAFPHECCRPWDIQQLTENRNMQNETLVSVFAGMPGLMFLRNYRKKPARSSVCEEGTERQSYLGGVHKRTLGITAPDCPLLQC